MGLILLQALPKALDFFRKPHHQLKDLPGEIQTAWEWDLGGIPIP
jgi:hypothetical protein